MNNYLQKFKESALLKGSAVIFIGTFIANISNYFYHLVMGRMLGPTEYGILASLLSILMIVSVPTQTIQTVVTQFVSSYKAEKKLSKVKYLYLSYSKKLFIGGLLVFALFLIFNNQISTFLKIEESNLIFLVGLTFVITFLTPINKGSYAGLQKFNWFAVIIALGRILRLALGIILVYLGFKVFGAVLAAVLTPFMVYVISLLPLRDIFKRKAKKINNLRKDTLKYSIPVLFSVLGITMIYNFDVILVKHFFEPSDAGLYAALSTLGKIVFFASTAVSRVLFPLVAEKFKKKENHEQIFNQSFALVSLVSLGVLAVYFSFPKIAIKVLFGAKYLGISKLLGIFGLAMVFFSLSNLLIKYFLSFKKTSFVYFLNFLVILEIVLISLFHNSLLQVTRVILFLMFILFVGLVIYYFKYKKEFFGGLKEKGVKNGSFNNSSSL